ncbi:MAG: hypothetical protein IM638_17905 [Bacteroidetes bacterium]|nr:hypothetical protein [Bacteroidota bacterium]
MNNKLPSDELYELVQSLSKNEKQYFKKYARIHINSRDNNYVVLFDALCKLKVYDEKKLRIQLEHTEFVNNLSRVKNYLYELITKSLKSYHSESSNPALVLDLIQRAEILLTKNLVEHSGKLIRRARKIAEKYDLSFYLIDIILWEMIIEIKEIPSHQVSSYYDRKLDELDYHSKLLRDQIEIDIIGRKLSFLISSQINRVSNTGNSEYVHLFDRIKQFENETTNYSSRKRLSILLIKQMEFLSGGNIDELKIVQNELFDFFQKQPHLISVYPTHYIASLQNQTVSLIQEKMYDEAASMANKLLMLENDYPEINNDFAREIIRDYYYTQMLACLSKKGDLDNTNQILEDASKHITRNSKNSTNPARKMNLFHSIAFSSFVSGNYKLCLKMTNQIINNKQFRNQLIYFRTILLNILVHIEKKDTDYASYALENYKALLHKKGDHQEFDELEFEAINSVCKYYSKNQEKVSELCNMYIKKLAELKNPYENDYLQISQWLKAKADNNTLAVFLQNEYKSHKNRI